MVRRTLIIFVVILFLLASGIVARDEVHTFVGRAGEALGSVLSLPSQAFSHLFRSEYPSVEELSRENELLKGELALLSRNSLAVSAGDAREAHVFSSYPFNHRGSITIDVGAGEGLRSGMGVAVTKMFLLGQIEQVFWPSSTVKTIFDDMVSLPVKIGKVGADALLVGGRTPHLTLIAKDAEISIHDAVYSTGPHFPYGLMVGEVQDIQAGSGSDFREASLKIPYDPGSLDAVSVFLQTPS